MIFYYHRNVFMLFCLYNAVTPFTLVDVSKSYAVYHVWNITTVGKLEFRFKTQSQYCLLLYADDLAEENVASINPLSKGSYLEIAIYKGQLEVNLQIYSENQLDKQTVEIEKTVNDLTWHWLKITKYVDTLKVELDEQVSLLPLMKKIFRIDSLLYIGGLPEDKLEHTYGEANIKPRFVGCVEDLSYSSGTIETAPVSVLAQGKAVEPTCVDACNDNPCKNHGKCINLFTRAGCDCFGTGYTGEKCQTPAYTIHQDEREYIKWSLMDSYTSTAKMFLRFRFKTAAEKGVLFYTDRNRVLFLVELLNGRLRIASGWLGTVPKELTLPDNLLDTKWHSLHVEKNGILAIVSLDDGPFHNFTIPSSNLKERNFEREPVYFGGIPFTKATFGVRSARNYMGCLQQVQYNKIDVIYSVLRTINKKIEKIGEVKLGCPYNETNIVTSTTTSQTTRDRTTTPTTKTQDQQNQKIIEKYHTRETSISQSVIVWITAAIVIGTIIIMISAACVVHHIRMKYIHKSRSSLAVANQHQMSETKLVPNENGTPTSIKSNRSTENGEPLLTNEARSK